MANKEIGAALDVFVKGRNARLGNVAVDLSVGG
jgi:hypothetical protein